jgi:hypothetical protein
MTVEHAPLLSLLIALVIAGSPIRAQSQEEWAPRRAGSGNLPEHGVMLLYRGAKDASRIFSLAHGGQSTWKPPQTKSTPCFVRVRDD